MVLSDAGPRDPEICEGISDPHASITCPNYTARQVIAAAQSVGVMPTSINNGVILDSVTLASVPSNEQLYRLLSNGTYGTAQTATTLTDWGDNLTTAITQQVQRLLIAQLPTRYVAAVGEPIVFDAQGSRSAYGPLAAYAWDFDNDGLTDTVTAEPTTTYTYTATYQGAARLTVSDYLGNTATTITRIGVPALRPTRMYLPFAIFEQP